MFRSINLGLNTVSENRNLRISRLPVLHGFNVGSGSWLCGNVSSSIAGDFCDRASRQIGPSPIWCSESLLGSGKGRSQILDPVADRLDDFLAYAVGRSGPGTGRTLRAMGEIERNLPTKFQVSPAQVEALLRGSFHTWASYDLSLSDAAFSTTCRASGPISTR